MMQNKWKVVVGHLYCSNHTDHILALNRDMNHSVKFCIEARKFQLIKPKSCGSNIMKALVRIAATYFGLDAARIVLVVSSAM